MQFDDYRKVYCSMYKKYYEAAVLDDQLAFNGSNASMGQLSNPQDATIVKVSKSPESIYSAKKLIDASKAGNDRLIIDIEEDVKPYYISCLEKNVNFKKKPENNVFRLQAGYEYRLIMNVFITGELVVKPVFVSYRDGEKMKVQKIEENKPLILNEGEDMGRLAFKVQGTGRIVIDNIFFISNKI
ncbi:hypothetical protein [Salinicoccus roseus]|uniref:hypothetical protein n=1 Tax=Salinicoccus roseus TaxID=45670 RepID=UPI00230086AB|nr:hypothetical protein [Salinicoccus roseus]